LTLGLPAGLVFALFDRRLGARVGGVIVVALVAAPMTATGIGIALLGVGAAVTIVSATTVARGDRQLGLDVLVVPALATAGIGLAAALAFDVEAVGRWEAALEAGVAEGGRRAVEQYRAFGMSGESLAALEALSADVAAGLVAVWPALSALALWLGVWIAHRLLGRWGRVGSDFGRRLTPLPFELFRPPEVLVWPLIAGLVGLWTDVDGIPRAAANVALALGVVYAIAGLAILWWWLGRRGMGTAWRIALVVIPALFPPFTLFAAAAWVTIGLADVWMGFREREQTS
jgi:hypothetical protein